MPTCCGPSAPNWPWPWGSSRAQQGLELAERAMRLDPLHPAIVASAVGFAAYYAGQYEKAIAAFKTEAQPALRPPHVPGDEPRTARASGGGARRGRRGPRHKPDFAAENTWTTTSSSPAGARRHCSSTGRARPACRSVLRRRTRRSSTRRTACPSARPSGRRRRHPRRSPPCTAAGLAACPARALRSPEAPLRARSGPGGPRCSTIRRSHRLVMKFLRAELQLGV